MSVLYKRTVPLSQYLIRPFDPNLEPRVKTLKWHMKRLVMDLKPDNLGVNDLTKSGCTNHFC
jgi:hypothetical protein